MRHNTPQEFIGVDIGSVRVGVARGSSAARLAEPLKTLAAADAIKQLTDIAAAHNAAGIVVGLPRGLDGQDTPQTKFVRDWVALAKEAIKPPFYWQDEALTTHSAQSQSSKAGLDAQAAAVILQDFLDTPEAERVRC